MSGTMPGDEDMERLVDAVEDPVMQTEARALTEILSEVTGEYPRLCGSTTRCRLVEPMQTSRSSVSAPLQ